MASKNRRMSCVVSSLIILDILSVACAGNISAVRQRRYDHISNASIEENTTTTCDCATTSSRLTCQTYADGCDSNEVEYNGSCYRFVTDLLKTRYLSKLDCIGSNSHLVYIESVEEQNFLVNRVSSLGEQDYWIGLTPVTVTYTWSDGAQYDLDWLSITDTGSSCGSAYPYRIGLIIQHVFVNVNTVPCNRLMPFICESNRTSTGCLGMHEFGDICFDVVQQEKNYSEARRYCEEIGGHLLDIKTNDQLDIVRYETVNTVSYWIGLTVLRTFGWMDGSPISYQSFVPSFGSEANVCFRLRHPSFSWEDRYCGRYMGYICERRKTRKASIQTLNEYVWCPSSIPVDLMRLSQSGSLCIHTGMSATLRACDTGDGIDDCTCYLTKNDYDMITCGCGFCRLTFDVDADADQDEYMVWPTEFKCSCSQEETTFGIEVENGTCSLAEIPILTTLGYTGQPTEPSTVAAIPSSQSNEYSTNKQNKKPTTDSYTTTKNKNMSEMDTIPPTSTETVTEHSATKIRPAEIAVGILLASMLLLVALVSCSVCLRKGGKPIWKKSDGTETSLASRTGSAIVNVNPSYGLDEDGSASNDILPSVTVDDVCVRP